MRKNAEELSLQTIIAFIIIIVVLVVMILLVTGQFGSISNYFSEIIKSITGTGTKPSTP